MAIRSARDVGIQRLYKFRGLTIRDRIEPIFRNQTLYWPGISELNDPFESRPQIVPPQMRNELEKRKVEWQAFALLRRNGMDRDEAKRRAKISTSPGFLQAKAAEMTLELPAALDKYRVFSLAGNCESILLWSHYAEAHTGICLGFSTDNQEFGDAIEVIYAKNLPTLEFLGRGNETNLIAMALTKSDEWKYEHEFRMLSQEPTLHGLPIVNDHKYNFCPEHLVEVVMGCNIKPVDEDFVREMVALSPTPIKIRKAIRSVHRFGVDIVDAY